jgi:carboxyl-terminal processing protease
MDDYELQLDDQIKETEVEFFEISYDIINKAVDKVREFYPAILNNPFDFSIDEEIETDGEKIEYARDNTELKEHWRHYLKYETLTRLIDKLEDQELADDPEGGKKSITELEQEAREEVLEVMDDWFERLGKLRRSDRFEVYLNSITNIFDPHTDYFNPKEKQDFDIDMSGRLEGIGARLQNDGDYTKVVSIVPGGPAWKQKDLEVDDRIYKVAQEGAEPVDVTGMHIDDVVSKIRGKKGTEVTLTVKKVDGESQEITILRDEVIIDAGFAKSVILNEPGKIEKIGYIKLPRFYADFDNPAGRSCAEDVAEELEKLKAEDVNGVILDLRYNSGGSLNDVVKMSGLFIEDGPIVQVKGRKGEPYVFKDKDEQVRYSGPLIVMVNSYSASASEILAAALQDYGRAVIVGGGSTFGKGTVQRFYNLDGAIRGNDEAKPLGQLKLTVQKFYRVNGGSTQLNGVVPDVILPDNFTHINIGERELDYPMEWTEIEDLDFEQRVIDLSNLGEIKIRSDQRISSNSVFQKIQENAKRVKLIREQSAYPLHLEKYQSLIAKRESEAEQYKDLFPELENLLVNNLAVDIDYIQSDSSRIGRNEAWIETIKKDIYIDETLSIMRDLAVNN